MLAASTRLLHVAPEPILARLLRSRLGVNYVSADLAQPATVRLDLSGLPFRAAVFGAVVCNHVLEHVPDDRAAIRELRRILLPSGWAILESPVDPHRAKTYEDPSIVDPTSRERVFGQFDHVRVYGRDYPNRLRDAGFEVESIPCTTLAGEGSLVRYGLVRQTVLLCRPRCE
jgi:SAM-dependent methyltransferase